jgi:hypothetical protein
MRYLDVCTKKQFSIGSEEKTNWNRVGTVRITGTGKMYLDLFMMPDTDFFLFEHSFENGKQSKELLR